MSDKFRALINQKYLIILLIITIVFIWGNSALPANVSSGISNGLMRFICSICTSFSESGNVSDGYLRKFAHAFEFACLGAELILLIRFNLKKLMSSAILFGLSTALVDETIQLFSEGRASQVKDIWIDMLGFLIGSFIVVSVLKYGGKKDSKLFDTRLSAGKGDDESEK